MLVGRGGSVQQIDRDAELMIYNNNVYIHALSSPLLFLMEMRMDEQEDVPKLRLCLEVDHLLNWV